MRRRRLPVALVGALAALVLSACGSAAQTGTHAGTRHSGEASPASAALSQPGSGAVTGTSTVDTTAAVPADTPPVDAVYGPPSSSIAAEDVPTGDSAASLRLNGTPAATGINTAARSAAAQNFEVPSDQNFTGQWFAPTSPWNTNVADLPVAANSRALLERATERATVIDNGSDVPQTQLVKTNGELFINTVAWTDPVVEGGPETAVHCRQAPNCGDDVGNQIKDLRIPANVNPNPYYDGWFTVISPNGKWAYDMWRARRLADGSISFQYMRIWNLQGSGYGQPSFPSARGSGLPLFAGLIRPAELQAGTIDHALAISVPGPAQRYYVAPASTTDGNGATNSLPEGARIRLKVNITIPPNSTHFHLTTGQRRAASALMFTLRNYGAIVVDRSAVPTLYAQEGVTAPLLVGNELQFLKLSDFQVVALPPRQQYPAANHQLSGAASQVSSVAADGGGS